MLCSYWLVYKIVLLGFPQDSTFSLLLNDNMCVVTNKMGNLRCLQNKILIIIIIIILLLLLLLLHYYFGYLVLLIIISGIKLYLFSLLILFSVSFCI